MEAVTKKFNFGFSSEYNCQTVILSKEIDCSAAELVEAAKAVGAVCRGNYAVELGGKTVLLSEGEIEEVVGISLALEEVINDAALVG